MRMSSKTILCGLSSIALLAAAGTSSAQGAPMKPSESMKDGTMASSKMMISKSEMKLMRKCRGMSHRKMMAIAKCKKMMDTHSEMMMSGGKMKK